MLVPSTGMKDVINPAYLFMIAPGLSNSREGWSEDVGTTRGDSSDTVEVHLCFATVLDGEI